MEATGNIPPLVYPLNFIPPTCCVGYFKIIMKNLEVDELWNFMHCISI